MFFFVKPYSFMIVFSSPHASVIKRICNRLAERDPRDPQDKELGSLEEQSDEHAEDRALTGGYGRALVYQDPDPLRRWKNVFGL